jgi:hypothetical protein
MRRMFSALSSIGLAIGLVLGMVVFAPTSQAQPQQVNCMLDPSSTNYNVQANTTFTFTLANSFCPDAKVNTTAANVTASFGDGTAVTINDSNFINVPVGSGGSWDLSPLTVSIGALQPGDTIAVTLDSTSPKVYTLNVVAAALTPTFGTPTATADGFTVQITNYDASYTWFGSASVGLATVSNTGLVTVTQVAAGTSTTATITTNRTNYPQGSATITVTVPTPTPSGSITDNGDGTATATWSNFMNPASYIDMCTTVGCSTYYRLVSNDVPNGSVAIQEGMPVDLGGNTVNLPAGGYYIILAEHNPGFNTQSALISIGGGGGGGGTNNGGTSSGAAASAPVEVSLSLDLATSDASCTGGSSATGVMGTWLTLPGASDCTSQTTPDANLLGWVTTADFPVDIAQRQIDNGWGAYELFNEEGRMTAVFIPAGQATFVSGPNSLHPIWAS